MEKNPETGSWIKIPGLILRTYCQFFGFKIIKFFDADQGTRQPCIRDGKKSDLGSGIKIPDLIFEDLL
jgi:hypothetical protein